MNMRFDIVVMTWSKVEVQFSQLNYKPIMKKYLSAITKKKVHNTCLLATIFRLSQASQFLILLYFFTCRDYSRQSNTFIFCPRPNGLLIRSQFDWPAFPC